MIAEDFQPPTILLVEKDSAVANAVRFSFELEGFDVRAFRCGDALLASGRLPARGCLVIDHSLPDVDGLRLLERLRAAHVTLPAILIATNPSQALRLQAAASGTPLIEKPLLTDALRDSVRAALVMH
jgi:FixJ family two-component response regulator